MALLMGDLYQRYIQHVRKEFGMGIANHKARHIAAFHGSGAGADAYSRNGIFLNMGKQPAGKLRQAFGMGKYCVGLTQTKLTLLYGQ